MSHSQHGPGPETARHAKAVSRTVLSSRLRRTSILTTKMMHLTAAAALLLAGTVSAQTAVSQQVFNQLVRYTTFAGAAYADTCATPPFGSTAVKYYNDDYTDTQATLFRDDTAKEIIISFRGTSSPRDEDTDLLFALVPLSLPGTSCSACKVHGAFQTAYKRIASAVQSDIQSQQSQYGGYSVVVTGHSLGAGLASLAGTSLAASGISPLKVYSIAEPRNGDPNFSTYVNKVIPTANYFRVTHSNDGVPQIPPTLLGYQHHGTEYWQSGNTSQSAATTYQCPGVDPTNCNAAQDYGQNVINGAHLFYSNQVIGNALNNVPCGATVP